MTRPPRRRRSRPLLKAEGRFGKEKSRSRKGAGFFLFTIYDLRLHLVDSWQMVVGSGDISPERSEPRKRSQEGCALAVVHGTGGGSRLSRPPLCCVSIVATASSPSCMVRGGGSRLSRPPLCCVSIVATYPPNEVSRASGRKRGAPSPSCIAWGGGSRLSRPPRMGSGRESLPRVRCPHAVFARAGARPSRGNISPERSEPRKRSQQVRPSRAYGGDSIEIALPSPRGKCLNQQMPKCNRKS